MSFPWWAFRVTFEDGEDLDFSATGATPTDGLHELVNDIWSEEDPLGQAYHAHGEVKSIEFLHCDTFGIDPESDRILQAEAKAKQAVQ